MELIDKHIINRSLRALQCLPFDKKFYEDAQINGLSAKRVFSMKERYLAQGGTWFKSPDNLENTFRWLITIGILRREVDGQGLTSKIRLTPLGKELLNKNPLLLNKKAKFSTRIKNWVTKIFLIQ